MKRMFILLVLVPLTLFCISCSPRISYTKEFPYLPSYNNMVAKSNEMENGVENEEQTGELKKVTYTIKDVDIENILTEYEKILQDDGWKITLDGKPNMLQIEKDEHTALIVVYSGDNEVLMDITSK